MKTTSKKNLTKKLKQLAVKVAHPKSVGIPRWELSKDIE
jgi:hypothetical protein